MAFTCACLKCLTCGWFVPYVATQIAIEQFIANMCNFNPVDYYSY